MTGDEEVEAPSAPSSAFLEYEGSVGDSSGVPSVRDLVGWTVRLRPVTIEDSRSLYALSTNPETGFRWRYRGRIPSLEEFTENLHRDVLTQFVVSAPKSHEVIGHVAAYRADFRNGHCYIGAVVRPNLIGSGMGAEGAVLLVDYLFANWNFRKIYLEAVSFNVPQFVSGMEKGIRCEGRLTDHHYHDGRFWDLLLLAVHRTDFYAWYPRFKRPVSVAD